MTSREYQSEYTSARAQWPKLTNATRRRIKKAYTDAARKIADIIRDGELVDGNFTFETQSKINQAFLEGSQAIGDAVRKEIPELVTGAALGYAAIETAFVSEAFRDLTERVTKEGIEKMFSKVTRETVQKALNSPLVNDGRIFWSRVPNIAKEFEPDIVALVRAAINEGRDIGKIAADINKYVKDGKVGTIHRWGDRLQDGTSELLKRVPKEVDYRALRLARSELGRGLMETAKANGPNNPGGSGWYDWVRVNDIDWGCSCPTNKANSPYRLEDYPPYAHPQCFCYCRQRMKDGNDFRRELEAWAKGGPNETLDKWYREKYLPNQL